jgi:phosphatidylinositol alpha-1,6-mannosyltransferase
MKDDGEPRRPDRLRVLVVSPDFPPAFGGIQRLIHRASLEFPDAEVRVLTLRAEGWREFDRTNRQHVRRFPAMPGPPALRNAVFNLQAVLGGLRWRPEVILAGHIVTGPACVALSKLHGVPIVAYLYGKEITARPWLTDWTLRHSAAGIAISTYSRDAALGTMRGGAPEIHVVPPGVDLADRPGSADATRPTVVTVARLRDWYKGHDVMLEALAGVRDQIPGVRWLVIGKGPLEGALRKRAAGLGLDDVVEFLGPVSDERRDQILSSAHVFAMTSREPPDSVGGEGFGIVYLEAASFGLAVVAGNVGGPREAVVDGRTGLLVDPTDPGAVGAALVRLLGDREAARDMGLAGRDRVVEEFSWGVIGARLADVLRQVTP